MKRQADCFYLFNSRLFRPEWRKAQYEHIKSIWRAFLLQASVFHPNKCFSLQVQLKMLSRDTLTCRLEEKRIKPSTFQLVDKPMHPWIYFCGSILWFVFIFPSIGDNSTINFTLDKLPCSYFETSRAAKRLAQVLPDSYLHIVPGDTPRTRRDSTCVELLCELESENLQQVKTWFMSNYIQQKEEDCLSLQLKLAEVEFDTELLFWGFSFVQEPHQQLS